MDKNRKPKKNSIDKNSFREKLFKINNLKKDLWKQFDDYNILNNLLNEKINKDTYQNFKKLNNDLKILSKEVQELNNTLYERLYDNRTSASKKMDKLNENDKQILNEIIENELTPDKNKKDDFLDSITIESQFKNDVPIKYSIPPRIVTENLITDDKKEEDLQNNKIENNEINVDEMETSDDVCPIDENTYYKLHEVINLFLLLHRLEGI